MEEAVNEREELISKHREQLKKPAIYALEVFITKAVIEPKIELTDLTEDVEPRFKFMHFPSVKLDVKGPEEETCSEQGVESPADVQPGKDANSHTEIPSSSPGKPSESGAGASKPIVNDEPSSAVDETEGKDAAGAMDNDEKKDECAQRINCDPNKMKDPNYFNPASLLKKNLEDNVVQGESLNLSKKKTDDKSRSGELKSSGTNKKDQENAKTEESQPSRTETNEKNKQKDEGDAKDSEENDRSKLPTIFINDGKTIIFCMKPFELMSALRRYPMTMSLTRPERQIIIGFSFLYVLPLIDAVDKSISLSNSVPICGLLSGSFDLVRDDEVIGQIDSDIRLHCFGPQSIHTIDLPNNPNLREERRPSNDLPENLLVIAQMSQPAMSKRRNPFSAKSRTEIPEKVIRDINTRTPLICGDEFQPPPQAKTEPVLSEVDKEEKEKEELRIELLTRFPQYKCLPSWDVVFNRRVIKDLIVKNRRPFQQGSADRLYIEKYFPELLPEKPKASDRQRRAVSKKKKSGDAVDNVQAFTLDIAEEWWTSEENTYRKKRGVEKDKKGISIGTPSTISLAKDLVGRNVKQMQPSAWSRVALLKFDPDNEDDIRDSRYNILTDVKSPRSKTSVSRMSAAGSSGRRSKDVFVVRFPRTDDNEESLDPVPERPLAFSMNLPWKTAPHDVVNEARRVGAEVDAIGGDTAEFYRKPKEEILLPKSKLPEHMDDISRGGRTMPLATPVVTLEIERGVPVVVPVRASPYWEGHVSKCPTPDACTHYVLLHPGYGFYGNKP